MRRVLSGTTVSGDVVSEGEEAELGVGGLVQRPRPDARSVLIGGQLLAARTSGAHLQYDPGRFISVWGDKRTSRSCTLQFQINIDQRSSATLAAVNTWAGDTD
jgi:hypothetical protein